MKEEAEAVSIQGAFTEDELNRIRELGDATQLEDATVLPGEGAPSDAGAARNGTIAWLRKEWLLQRIWSVMSEVNERFFGFQLEGTEMLQYTVYREGDYYKWHIDKGRETRKRRKLSMTIQLSHPEEYDGGDLELQPGLGVVQMPKDFGRVIAFPSWVLHQVTPVSRGTRRSLVVWAHGEPFQ